MKKILQVTTNQKRYLLKIEHRYQNSYMDRKKKLYLAKTMILAATIVVVSMMIVMQDHFVRKKFILTRRLFKKRLTKEKKNFNLKMMTAEIVNKKTTSIQ